MRIVIVIDGREAIPVRAIPFAAGWMISPDVVAMTFAKTDHWITRLDGVTAYYLSVSGKYSPMLAKEWDGIEADLKILSDKLKVAEEFEQENYPAWRQQSILRLPASCFVWRDKFEEAFRRSYSPEHLILSDERPGDRELNFSPRIPEELALAVMQGFSMFEATDLAQKKTRLAELQRELVKMKEEERQPSKNPAESDDFGGDGKKSQTDTKHPGHLNHDPQMQQRANEIAAAQMAATKRPITRDKVAKFLAKELEMDVETVLRRIRKQWK